MIRFSIVIPTYNRADLIGETLEKLQNQKYRHWECIIVDDGSTDDTKEVIDSWTKKDDRISYLYQENAERSAARNNGGSRAKGHYIIFLDSDDCFPEDYLLKLSEFLSREGDPVALIVSDFYIWDGNQLFKEVKLPEIKKNGEWLFNNPVSPSRAVLHRDIFEQYKFREDIVIVEDTVLWVSIIQKYPMLRFTGSRIWYRFHEGNSVNQNTDAAFKRMNGLKLFFSSKESELLTSKFKRKILSETYYNMAKYYRIKEKFVRYYFTILRSIVLDPGHLQTKTKVYELLSSLPLFSLVLRLIKSR